MSPRKLTEDDKQSMLKLYRDSAATTSTLATEFGVSSSTVSRFLKSSLSTGEYEDLIQQKRLARTTKGETPKSTKQTKSKKPTKQKKTAPKTAPTSKQSSDESIVEPETVQEAQSSETKTETKSSEKKVRRRRRSRKKEPEIATEKTTTEAKILAEKEPEEQETIPVATTEAKSKPSAKATLKLKSELPQSVEESAVLEEDDNDDEDEVDVSVVSAMLGEEEDFADEDEDDEGDDEGDDDEDEDDYAHPGAQDSLEILPLASANLPRTCYLVVDRAAELIAKPLREFADLGVIPETEVQQKTLPVFDNHRVAKRFSHRREKVIKVPNGKMLQKTSSYLYDKGITRLLIRGQIYDVQE